VVGGRSQSLDFYTCHPCDGKTHLICSECGKCLKRILSSVSMEISNKPWSAQELYPTQDFWGGTEIPVPVMSWGEQRWKLAVLKWINFLVLGKIVDGLLVMRKIEVSWIRLFLCACPRWKVVWRINKGCSVVSHCLCTGYQGIPVLITGIVSCHRYKIAGNLLRQRLSCGLTLEMPRSRGCWLVFERGLCSYGFICNALHLFRKLSWKAVPSATQTRA